MSNLSNSSAEPSYISRLGLHSAPFSIAVESRSFFNGEQIEQRLNLLFHLARSSDKVGLLIAEQGVGKSTVLTQLQQGAGDDLRICRIDVQASLDSPTLIEQCLRAFGVDDIDGNRQDEHEGLLKDRLKRLQKLNIRRLLLVDNIDIISADNLATLLDWLSWQDDDEFLLQAIFTASRMMPELDNIHGRLQRVDLPDLAEHELSTYLMKRLEMAGFKGEIPFSSKELKQFYKQTLGRPAAVNQLAHQKLLGIKLTPGSAITINFASLFRWTGVLLLILSFILLLVFQDKINALFVQDTEQSDVIEQAFNTEEDSLATVIAGEDNVTSSEQAERNQLATLVAELPVIEKELEFSTIELKSSEVDELTLQDAPEEIMPKASPTVHQQDWIMLQQGSNYTFQLMGSWDHSEVTKFIEEYDLSGELAEFESERNGRVWYALVYGVYNSKQLALQASSHWPEPLNTLPSWLRRFDSVQKQIKSTVQAQ